MSKEISLSLLARIGILLAIMILLVGFFIFSDYVTQPRIHARVTERADALNDRYFSQGEALIVTVELRVDTPLGSEIRDHQLVCFRKRETIGPSLKNSTMTWDLMHVSGETTGVVALDFRQIEFNLSVCHEFDTNLMLRMGRTFPLTLRSSNFDTFIRAAGEDCKILVQPPSTQFGDIEIFAPVISDAFRVPVADVLTREEIGPADRDIARLSNPESPRERAHPYPPRFC